MVFMNKEHCSTRTYDKLQPKKYCPLKIVKKLNDNAYEINLQENMGISYIFNEVDLYPNYPSKHIYSNNYN